LRTDWVDFDGNAVPQGAAPDIGAFEYCEGTDCQEATEIATGGSTGTGGAAATGGAPASGGNTPTGTGGAQPTGGAPQTGGNTPTGTGGASALTCTEPFTLCGNVCVNLDSDSDNCGQCGNACAPTEVCSAGVCTTGGCPTGTTQCDQSCVDILTDPLHCGGCNLSCDAGQTCTNGVCTGEATGGDPTQPIQQAAAEPTTEESGCACATAASGSTARGVLLGLLLGLGLLWRRRRRVG
jgi:MYXO-CTERM domain-containing protein